MIAAPSWESIVENGDINLKQIANKHGTPCFIYSEALIKASCARYKEAVKPLHNARLRYATKANGNLAVLNVIRKAGFGFDIASTVELARVRAVGANPQTVIFTGSGKRQEELEEFVRYGGEEVIIDSAAELVRLKKIATCDNPVTVGVRVNPDLDAFTHPHISTGKRDSKFGVTTGLLGSKFGEQANTGLSLMLAIAKDPNLLVGSLNCHIGSQVTQRSSYEYAFIMLLAMQWSLKVARQGITVNLLDIGGGFAIGDGNDRPADDVFVSLVGWLAKEYPATAVGFQPGRSIVGRAGILLTRVEYVKEHHIVVDAGMTELMRPALYDAIHGIAKLGQAPAGFGECDVVGPVCESADWLARKRNLKVKEGDLLTVFDAGAYAAGMMSTYNGRLRPCELLVTTAGKVKVARRRDTIDETLALEDF